MVLDTPVGEMEEGTIKGYCLSSYADDRVRAGAEPQTRPIVVKKRSTEITLKTWKLNVEKWYRKVSNLIERSHFTNLCVFDYQV